MRGSIHWWKHTTSKEMHLELEGLLRDRARFEKARTDPNFRVFKPVREHRTRVSEDLVCAIQLYHRGLAFAARVIGDEALGIMQPPADVERLARKSLEFKTWVARFDPLLPHRKRAAGKHRLVAVLWLNTKLLTYRYKKSAHREVGDAYGRGPQTIRGWAKEFGTAALEIASEQGSRPDPRDFYELVFRQGAGKKSLSDCGKAFKEWLRATTQSKITGRPTKKSL